MGLSFLLFLAGSEVDLRRFRGALGRRVAMALGISLIAAAAVGVLLAVIGVSGVSGAVLVAVALVATSLGLIVPVLADADALSRPVGGWRWCCSRSGCPGWTPRSPASWCCWSCCSGRSA